MEAFDTRCPERVNTSEIVTRLFLVSVKTCFARNYQTCQIPIVRFGEREAGNMNSDLLRLERGVENLVLQQVDLETISSID